MRKTLANWTKNSTTWNREDRPRNRNRRILALQGRNRRKWKNRRFCRKESIKLEEDSGEKAHSHI